jgi:hypothetical protein
MRIRNHLRSNVIGYVALFFALSSSALAANTVFSEDIVNGEVKRVDLANNAVNAPKIAADGVGNSELADGSVTGPEVLDASIANTDLANGSVGSNKVQDGAITSAKVLDDNQTGGGLGPQDLQTNAVAQAEIATNGVAATEVQDDSIDSGEIVDFGLTNQDVGVLFAEVSATAVLDNHSGGVTATRVGAVGSGQYEVDFGRNIAQCTAVATMGLAGAGSPVAGEVYVADRSGNAEAVFVDTNTSAGAAADRAFRLVVVC